MKIRSLFFISVMVMTRATTLFGQASNHNVREQALKYASAFEHEDLETVISFIYPKVIENFGGHDKMLAMMKDRMEAMKQSGASFEPTIIGQPSEPVKAGAETHCLIVQTQTVKESSGKSKMESTLLAVTRDNGAHWYFISLENYTQESIRALLPNYNPVVKVPAKKRPQFIPN